MPYLSNGFSAGSAQAPFTQASFAAMMPNTMMQRPGSAGPAQNAPLHSAAPNNQVQSAQMHTVQRPGMPQAALGAGHQHANGSMPMVSQATASTQQSPAQSRNQPDLTSPSLATADSSIGNMNLANQQQAAMLRNQQIPTANGPLMSNGKPALLRGAAARDGGTWTQSPTMVSIIIHVTLPS